MSNSPVFLDVNVPMYAAGKPHDYKDSCVWVMREIAHGRLTAVIDTEIIQEVLYRYGALRQWQIAASMSVNLLTLIPTVYPISTADIHLTVNLFQRYAPQGVKARDIIHAAVMQNNGLTRIISTDKHFDAIDGIVRVDPQRLFLSKDTSFLRENS